jgi:DNA-binding LacI/PurR family transcriptional regulator
MGVKLKDIAKESGVSISTVSRILSRDQSRKSNDETVKKVYEVAEKLGYFAQKLGPLHYRKVINKEKQYAIGCVLTSEHESYVSPFFSTLLTGIQEEIHRLGPSFSHNFFVVNIKDPGFMQFLESTHLDCAIMLGRTTYDNIKLLKQTIPCLVYAGINKIGNGIDEVLCDAHEGVVTAVDYLISLGHKEIAFIGPTQQKHTVFNEHRYGGYLESMKAHNLVIKEEFVLDTILTATDGYTSMNSLIKRGTLPTAICCGNDTVAMGVMKALDEHHIKVPKEVSVIGFDNIDNVAYLKPALTTIDVPKKELGRLAVKVLIDRLESKREYCIKVTLPFSLIERESCRRVDNG